MDTDTKEALAHLGKTDNVASAIRAKAARLAIGLSQPQLGEKIGKGKSTISNVEKGLSHPGRDLMIYLSREHRIDFNFMMAGHFSQLPADVQDVLFPALATVNSEWDQESNSD